jgi:hypothetical protein
MDQASAPLYQYIFNLLDFGDELFKQLADCDDYDRNNYILILIYIEDILDKGGRAIVSQSARQHLGSFEEGQKMKIEATKRMDMLRGQLNQLVATYDLDEIIKGRSAAIFQRWQRRS